MGLRGAVAAQAGKGQPQLAKESVTIPMGSHAVARGGGVWVALLRPPGLAGVADIPSPSAFLRVSTADLSP